MLEFKIQINNGVLVTINTPIDFEKTDFNLTRSKDLHSITSSFAGNKASFVFQKDIHNNVFEDIINEYENKGFNADVKLFIYWNGNLVFDGIFDFLEAETDMVNEIKCQVVKKDKLFYLEKNKSVDIDLFSSKNLDNNYSEPINTVGLRMDSIKLLKNSRWEDTEEQTYIIAGSIGISSFNNIRKQVTYEINDSLNWLSTYELWLDERGINHQVISAKENLNNINVNIKYDNGSFLSSTENGLKTELYICYGREKTNEDNRDWFNNLTRIKIKEFTVNLGETVLINIDYNINIPNLQRGSGIWVYWYSEATTFGNSLYLNNKNSVIDITAETTTYPSYLNSVKYSDLIRNLVKKTTNINNIRFNIDWYNNTYAFNANLLRRLFSSEMNVKWEDVKKQLNERNLGCYYEESTDTLVFDHRSSILGYNKIQDVGDLAKQGEYNVSEDSQYVINQFGFKYNKYQALKENAIEGNNATIHGASEWFVNNKGYEGKINVELPFIRDSFMIEDLRRQSLIYREDTSTSDSDDIILIETTPITSLTTISEDFYVSSSFADGQQTFINDGSFSFRRVIGDNTSISINNSSFNYYIISITDTTLILGKADSITQEINGIQNVNIRWRFTGGVRSKLTNGLINTDFSVRQNIEYWKQTLQATNYYNRIPITNTMYKENKTEVINGLLEVADIITIGGLTTPRYIENKVVISVNDYFNLSTNKIGYITIYNSKSEQVNIYLDELNASFIDGCERMEATFKGWLKIDLEGYNTLKVTKDKINNYIISGLSFIFNDTKQLTSFCDRFGNIIYKDVIPTKICSNEICFLSYSSAKNYLLSL